MGACLGKDGDGGGKGKATATAPEPYVHCELLLAHPLFITRSSVMHYYTRINVLIFFFANDVEFFKGIKKF